MLYVGNHWHSFTYWIVFLLKSKLKRMMKDRTRAIKLPHKPTSLAFCGLSSFENKTKIAVIVGKKIRTETGVDSNITMPDKE